MKTILKPLTLISSILFLAYAASVQADVIAKSTWDDGTTQGWTLGADERGRYEFRTAGGNPDGYVAFVYGSGDFNPGMFAPPWFLGDYSSLGPEARFEFDARVEAALGDLVDRNAAPIPFDVESR